MCKLIIIQENLIIQFRGSQIPPATKLFFLRALWTQLEFALNLYRSQKVSAGQWKELEFILWTQK